MLRKVLYSIVGAANVNNYHIYAFSKSYKTTTKPILVFSCRVEWGECSRSPECRVATEAAGPATADWQAVQQCADSCLTAKEAAREQARLARLHQESQAQLQLQYSASHSAAAARFHLCAAVAVVTLVLQCLVRL